MLAIALLLVAHAESGNIGWLRNKRALRFSWLADIQEVGRLPPLRHAAPMQSMAGQARPAPSLRRYWVLRGGHEAHRPCSARLATSAMAALTPGSPASQRRRTSLCTRPLSLASAACTSHSGGSRLASSASYLAHRTQ